MKDKEQWSLVGKTEVVKNNLNPDFATTIECDYFFEREQRIRFTVNDVDGTSSADFIGLLETTIGKIIGAPKQTFLADLTQPGHSTSRGKIVIRIDSVNQSNDEVRLKFSARLQPHATFCCEDENNPYFVISRARDPLNPTEYVRVFKSQPLKNTANPSFAPAKLCLSRVCNGNRDLPLKIQVYSANASGDDTIYGEADTTVNKIALEQLKELELRFKELRKGTLLIEQFEVVEKPSFMEYLRSGWGVNTSFAIDFTASNGELTDVRSLHRIDQTGHWMNQYERALLEVGRVVEPYAVNNQFAVFGFGGIPLFLGSNAISHCFNLNGQNNPVIIGLNNVYSAYREAVLRTGLAGPTYFSHVLSALLAYVQQSMNLMMYHCMLIITDGDIHDMAQTTDLIIELSKYPVSLIIIGVGDDSFDKMVQLDSDDRVLRGSKG